VNSSRGNISDAEVFSSWKKLMQLFTSQHKLLLVPV